MAEIKTKATAVSVDAFIEAVDNPVRRADAKAVREMMERISGLPAQMWGPSIIGFGSYRYRYDSGHEGIACRLGFSPRKAQLVLYVLTGYMGENKGEADLLSRLGKHKIGKSCLYINKLADVDMAALEKLLRAGVASMKARAKGTTPSPWSCLARRPSASGAISARWPIEDTKLQPSTRVRKL